MITDTIECAFSGRIGQEPQLKTSKAGKSWLSFSAVVGSGDDAQWLQIAVFNDLATEMASRLHKGDRVYVEGRIRLNTWQDKDGASRAGLSVAATLVQPLGQIGRRKPAAQRSCAVSERRRRDQRTPASPDFDDRDRLSYLAA